MNFENILNNLIFCLLLFSVIATSDIQEKQSSEIFKENLINGTKEREFSKSISPLNFFALGGTVLLTFLLSYRWIESGHPPLSNLYESLLFLTWTFLIFYLILIFDEDFGLVPFRFLLRKNRSVSLLSSFSFFVSPFVESVSSASLKKIEEEKIKSGISKNEQIQEKLTKTKSAFSIKNLLGFLLLSTALFVFTFANWRLPAEMQTVTPLVPALQSNWLLMHVSIMLLSYSSLLAGSLFSMSYLFVFYYTHGRSFFTLQKTERETNIADNSPFGFSEEQKNKQEIVSFSSRSLEKNERATKILSDLDQYSYRSLSFAFPLLTLGIISGAVWANEAWGSYWSWDPKETWAFITWLIFAIYLHVRMNKGWTGSNAAWVATFGFFMIWICYLGVNLLGKGLHSYGWWQN